MFSYSATFQACRLPTPNMKLSLSIPTMCCSGSCCDHHLWHEHMKLLGFLVNWNTPTMIVDPNCAILSWYTDTFMTPEPYDVQDPGLLVYYTRKKWGHRYFLPRQALTRRLDFGTLKSWEVAVILDSIGSRVVAIHPTQCIITHPFHETSLHSFIHSFILVYRVFKTSLEDLFFPSFVATHLKYTTLSKIKLN